MKKLKISVLIALLIFLFFNIAYSEEENDPLITQSYMELRLQQIKTYIDEKIDNISSDGQNTNPSNIFKPVTVKSGVKVIGDEGTELILRAGNAKAIANTQGGIIDTTGAIDIQNNKDIPKQHLLIIPRKDGRGVIISSKEDAVIMIKGNYTIE
jgi:hypothetical protein